MGKSSAYLGWLQGILAVSAALGMQGALADNLNGCPDGQAIQAADPSGKKVRCIPVPPPVDVSGLQSQINAEAAARATGDGALLNAIADALPARAALRRRSRLSSRSSRCPIRTTRSRRRR